MAQNQPVPQYAMPFLGNEEEMLKLGLRFNPVWLKWFLDTIDNLATGGLTEHNSLGGLQGGIPASGQFYHLSQAAANAFGAVQSANSVYAGPTSGGAATPAFRALVESDIPALSQATSGASAFTTNANLTASASFNSHLWERHGNSITLHGQLVVTAVSGTDVVTLSLPVASAPSSGTGFNAAVGACAPWLVTTGSAGLAAYIGPGASIMRFHKLASGAVYTSLTNADLVVGASIEYTITYKAS